MTDERKIRKAEQDARRRLRDRQLAEAFRRRHPRSYLEERRIIDDLIAIRRGALPPGGKK